MSGGRSHRHRPLLRSTSVERLLECDVDRHFFRLKYGRILSLICAIIFVSVEKTEVGGSYWRITLCMVGRK